VTFIASLLERVIEERAIDSNRPPPVKAAAGHAEIDKLPGLPYCSLSQGWGLQA
jgi:hypothetical protein